MEIHQSDNSTPKAIFCLFDQRCLILGDGQNTDPQQEPILTRVMGSTPKTWLGLGFGYG